MMRRGGESTGGNVHFLAASMATRSKYLLGPVRSGVAAKTEPSWSTMTRTQTLTCPRMVRRAFFGMSGITSWSDDGELATSFLGEDSEETSVRTAPGAGAAAPGPSGADAPEASTAESGAGGLR